MNDRFNDPYEFESIREMLTRQAGKYPDTIAYKYKNKNKEIVSVSYKEFYDLVNNLGASLTEKGFGKSHISVLSENRFEYILVYLTTLCSEGVFQPVDKDLTKEDVVHILTEGDSEILFYSNKYEEKVKQAIKELDNIKMAICFDDSSFTDIINEGKCLDKASWFSLKSDPYKLKMLVYTSGTTGIAKGVMLSEHNLVYSIRYGVKVSQIYDTALSVLPYHHTYESVCDILVNIYYHGTLCINHEMKSLLKDMEDYKPTNVYIVPAIAEFIYNNIVKTMKKQNKYEKFQKAVRLSNLLLRFGIDLRKLLFKDIHKLFGGRMRKIICGGAPIRPEMGKFFGDVGIVMTGGYGITECSPLVSVNDEKTNRFDTAGCKLGCLDWRIDQPNEEGIGEIQVKGDVVMMGYYKNPMATENAFNEGWFRTGDYGYITEDDQIVITGRKKNIIVLKNGKNIYPEEIENKISVLDQVTEVVVRSIKDEKGDEIGLMAEVYSSDENVTEDVVFGEIKKITENLPAYKHVSKVVLRSEPFKKTTSNKIIR